MALLFIAMPVPALRLWVPGKVWPAAKVILPVLSMKSFCTAEPVGPNWKLRLPSFNACSCADSELLDASVALSCRRFEGCDVLPFGASACVAVNVLAWSRLAKREGAAPPIAD